MAYIEVRSHVDHVTLGRGQGGSRILDIRDTWSVMVYDRPFSADFPLLEFHRSTSWEDMPWL